MTEAEREALVERMAQCGCDRADPPGVSTWSALSEVAKEEWRLDMRAALAVAEPVVREECCKALEEMAEVEANPARASALSAGAVTIRLVAAHQNRARGGA